MKETIKTLSSRIKIMEEALRQLINLSEKDVGKSTKQAAAYLHLLP